MRAQVARRAWLGYWDLMARYHRYEVVGLHHLEGCRPALIVGYHGRPIARDLCMLQSVLHKRDGRFPRAVMHESAKELPVAKHLVEGMQFLSGEGPEMDAAVAAGEHVLVTPGGTREGCRSHRHHHRVEWGRRAGYLRLALRHRLPIIPAAAHGVDDTYFGLNDGYAWGKRVGMPGKMPLWFGVGPLGLWPVSPPFPVKLTTFLGAPMRFDVDPDDAQGVQRADHEVRAAVQRLLDLGAAGVDVGPVQERAV
jgi:hypothetical protein